MGIADTIPRKRTVNAGSRPDTIRGSIRSSNGPEIRSDEDVRTWGTPRKRAPTEGIYPFAVVRRLAPLLSRSRPERVLRHTVDGGIWCIVTPRCGRRGTLAPVTSCPPVLCSTPRAVFVAAAPGGGAAERPTARVVARTGSRCRHAWLGGSQRSGDYSSEKIAGSTATNAGGDVPLNTFNEAE